MKVKCFTSRKEIRTFILKQGNADTNHDDKISEEVDAAEKEGDFEAIYFVAIKRGGSLEKAQQ